MVLLRIDPHNTRGQSLGTDQRSTPTTSPTLNVPTQMPLRRAPRRRSTKPLRPQVNREITDAKANVAQIDQLTIADDRTNPISASSTFTQSNILESAMQQSITSSKPVLRLQIMSNEEEGDHLMAIPVLSGPSPLSLGEPHFKNNSSTSSTLSLDWSFLRTEKCVLPSPTGTECPSLVSASATSSRNSSVKSTKSARLNRWIHFESYTEPPDYLSVTSAARVEDTVGSSNEIQTEAYETHEAPKKEPFAVLPSRGVNIEVTESRDISDLDSTDVVQSSLRCLSLSSSSSAKSSDEETESSGSSTSPQSSTGFMQVWPVLSPAKQRIVDIAMAEFHRIFANELGTNDPSSNRDFSEGSHSNGTGNSGNSSNGASRNSSSRKRSLSGGGSPPNNNRDDPNKRRRPDGVEDSERSTAEKRFACPFFKRNPGRHQTFTSCRDPGFVTVARLKEHLYRRHLLPPQCLRCSVAFPTETSLKIHLRDPQGCEVREQISPEGFDKDQERKLKSKKRSQKSQNEEEKWRCVYNILFPDDNPDNMPSPYIEYQAPGISQINHSTDVARFQAFSRLELPKLVRQTLEMAVEREAQPLGEKLKDQLVDIVKECQARLFTMFEGPDRGSSISPNTSTARLNSLPSMDSSSETLLEFTFPDFDSLTSGYDFDVPNTIEGGLLSSAHNTKESFHQKESSCSPDSGYDSSLSLVTVPPNLSTVDPYLFVSNPPPLLDGFYGLFEDRNIYDAPIQNAMWQFDQSSTQFNNPHVG